MENSGLIVPDRHAQMINEFEGRLGFKYNNKYNALIALTHSSYANENKHEKLHSNERLEFLGDAVLNITISDYVFKNCESLSEGEMTKLRANIVCEPSLMKCADKINLGNYLLLGKGEENTGGRKRASILADAFEALIGSIYMDSGMQKAQDFIFDSMGELIARSLKGGNYIDYKTQLQELLQKNSDRKITYEIIDEIGPDHDKLFISQVKVMDKVAGTGKGRSKKEAEQNAAKEALGKFEGDSFYI